MSEKDDIEKAYYEASRTGSFDDELYEGHIKQFYCALGQKVNCNKQCAYCKYYDPKR